MKKNKLSKMEFTSVDTVGRGANQGADIVFYKSDTPENEERSVLKKAFDYLKTLFGDEPETITKSDIASEYDKYASQLLKSFDGIIADEELSADERTDKIQKSIDEFSAFMKQAAPIWAKNQSVVKSADYETMIKKTDEIIKSNRKESGDMPLSVLTSDEQKILKSLLEKMQGEDEKKPPFVPAVNNVNDDDDSDPSKVVPTEEEEAKKGDKCNMNKSENAIPEFVTKALERAENFMAEQELKEMTALAKKYEVLGEKPDELGKQLYDLKKSDSKLYDTSIAMLDRQIDAIEKSGIFAEIGKSGATHNTGSDTVAKVQAFAKSFMEKDPTLGYDEAMVKAWEAHPELADEYESNY